MQEERKEQLLSSGWHLLLLVAAVVEFRASNSSLRRKLVGACAGWHAAAMVDDWLDGEKAIREKNRK